MPAERTHDSNHQWQSEPAGADERFGSSADSDIAVAVAASSVRVRRCDSSRMAGHSETEPKLFSIRTEKAPAGGNGTITHFIRTVDALPMSSGLRMVTYGLHQY
jgi:hypothetical protein